ncbi:hypothetical protein [Polynucleobacter necessarius]|uniref:hypothetical protein n=1 Tax=Polynucleobacter necessarius TaxID=576610 RepID=UPI000E092BCF|nr:hypothetical protein [Polynucleobacter necessarius]
MPSLIKKSVAEYGQNLAKEGGKKLLDFKKLAITLKWTKLVLGELGFDEIVLEEPKLLLEKNTLKAHGGAPASVWNWKEFVHAVEKKLATKR